MSNILEQDMGVKLQLDSNYIIALVRGSLDRQCIRRSLLMGRSLDDVPGHEICVEREVA